MNANTRDTPAFLEWVPQDSYIGNSEMSAWANTGLLVAATDRARTHMQSGWVQDGNDD